MEFLAIGAHPDDIDFTAGATVARLSALGHNVVYCLATNGQAGGTDTSKSRLAQAKDRKREQEVAADILGVDQTVYLDLSDGTVEATLELRRRMTSVIRRHKPDVVICPSPRYNLNNVHFLHPDHLAVGAGALSAIYPDARNAFAFPELALEPHTVSEAWLVEDPEPDYFVESSGYLGQKLEALGKHSSQFATTDDLRQIVAEKAASAGDKATPRLGLAESFRRIVYHRVSDPFGSETGHSVTI